MRVMPCKELIGFLAEYLEGSLDPKVRAEFEHHLSLCPPCVAYLKSYTQTVQLSKAAFEESPPPPPPEDLVKAILEARKRQG